MRDKPHCGLRADFRTCFVHPWVCNAPGAGDRGKAAPVQLQPCKQKPPASSRSVHTEMPIHFQNQILHEYTEQKWHFLLSGQPPYLSPLVKKQLEQAEEMERHRASTLSAKAAYQSSGAWLGPEQPWGSMSCKDKQEKGHRRLLQAGQSSRLPSRSSRLRDSLGVLCQDPSTEQCPIKPRSHWRKQSIFFKMQFLDLASSAAWLYTKTRLPIFATLDKIFVFSTVKTFLTFPCIPHSYHSAEAVCENGKCHRHSSSASLIFPVDLAIIANNTGRAQ